MASVIRGSEEKYQLCIEGVSSKHTKLKELLKVAWSENHITFHIQMMN